MANTALERLQRVLASRGVASRRKSEDLIREGRVTVDGAVVSELGIQVDAERQEIRVDGKPLQDQQRRYILLNKPEGYITTAADERGRRTVLDLVDVPQRVVPVGRLDRHTTGLLLLTNDGDIAFRVTHPRFGVEKEYEALLDGHPPPAALQSLRQGVTVEGKRVCPEQVRPLRNEEGGTRLRIVIHEGQNRIVRKMLDRIGYPAVELTRTRIGPLQLRGIPLGSWRDLSEGELQQLREAVHLTEEDLQRPQPARRFPTRPPGERGQDRGRSGRFDRSGGRGGPGERTWRPARRSDDTRRHEQTSGSPDRAPASPRPPGDRGPRDERRPHDADQRRSGPVRSGPHPQSPPDRRGPRQGQRHGGPGQPPPDRPRRDNRNRQGPGREADGGQRRG
ncbi:MAG TPA: pseudouridine synthase, partial [Thermomicrobiaceae bacterium]|nr:pseudouridine synthase [Thermomicrobiaceae bacterium]